MASEEDIFNISGPLHLKDSFDWNTWHHRISLASCLVQGVYVMEEDRQRNRIGRNSEANHWWEFFGFILAETLIDGIDDTIYGAVFEYKHYEKHKHELNHTPPRYVIAFRGTILTPETFFRDMENNILFFFDSLHRGSRFKKTVQTIQNIVDKHGCKAVWLAGHSLGADLTILAGKTMAMNGCPLEAHIFNPPIIKLPLERLVKSKILKTSIRFFRDVVKSGVATVLGYREVPGDELLRNLASWVPNIYVHQSDPICSEYIGTLRHKITMSMIGADKLERIATRFSMRGILLGGAGSPSSSEPLHFIPSAVVTVNKTPSNIKKAHGIRQWYDQRFVHEHDLYEFRSGLGLNVKDSST